MNEPSCLPRNEPNGPPNCEPIEEPAVDSMIDAMSNVYNVLFEQPVYEKPLNKPYEALAQALVAGGRMRIDAFEKINFIRFPAKGQDVFLSYRELHDPRLVTFTEQLIGKTNVELLRKEIAKNRPVPEDIEIKLARLVVQAAHPSVIELMLIERVEIFLSYSYNIGDLLDFVSWQEQGSNSGMQSVGFGDARIFVSCDGDPFSKDEEAAENTKYSLGRFMTIAGQEIGHYSDLRRNRQGVPVARFSLDSWRYASSVVADARKKDILWGKKVEEIFNYLNLNENVQLEKSITFFKKHRKFSFSLLWAMLKSYCATKTLQQRAKKFNVKIAHLHDARHLAIMLADMRFNLSPRAPVYERSDPREQEAIMCVEALARVPQQAIKWGHKTTAFMYPNLYRFYYNKVIPANIEVVKNLKSKTIR